MKKILKNISPTIQFVASVVLITLVLGYLIISMYSTQESTVELNQDVAFEKDRTILKMRKDSLLMILSDWQSRKASKFTSIDST
ncbi:MAG: hypothetical protein AAF617_05365, partial [Bacteroidota bacterium]